MGDELHCVVRVLAGDQFLGSGFLVAPDRVLTCKHVVVERVPETGKLTEAVHLGLRIEAHAGQESEAACPHIGGEHDWDLALLTLSTAIPVSPLPMLWGLTEVQEPHLRRAPIWAYGYPMVESATQWRHPMVELCLLPSARAGTQIVTQLQLTGGIPQGCSGGPALLRWGEQWVYVGTAYLGGEGAGTSRLIMADPAAEFLHASGLHEFPRLDAPRALALIPADALEAEQLIERPGIQETRPNPYKGLFSFGKLDAPYFFGREERTNELFDAVQRHPLVTLIGASGSGKSSLLLAGLLPRLLEVQNWHVVKMDFRPPGKPFHGMAGALAGLFHPELDDWGQSKKQSEMAEDLLAERPSLVDALSNWSESHPERRVLLIVDQFEELYTQNTPKEQVQRFLDALLALIQAQSALFTCTVLLALRADFMDKLLAYAPLAEAIDANAKKMLGRMDQEGLRAAIEEPAKQLGVTLEPGLTNHILEDLGGEPGALPLLEFTLTELWKRETQAQLTHQAYEAIEGVQGSLAQHAERALDDLKAPENQIRRIFVQLVRPGEGTEDTRQVATREQIGEESWSLVKRLADRRLVVTGGDEAGKEQTLEVVHEALIRNWSRLREWIDADREFLRTKARIQTAAELWEQEGRAKDRLLPAGRPSAEAADVLDTRRSELGTRVVAYIEASLAAEQEHAACERLAQRRRLNRARTAAAAMAVLASIAFGLGYLAYEAFQGEKKERNAALARQLAAQANLLVERGGGNQTMERAAALAVESWRRLKNADAHAVAGKLLSWSPVVTVDRAQDVSADESRITSIAVSPDGRLLAMNIGANGGPVRLVDVKTGAERARIPGKFRRPLLDFSPDGRLFLAFARNQDDEVIGRLIDTATGKALLTMDKNLIGRGSIWRAWGHFSSGGFASYAFSHDGRWLAYQTKDAIRIVDTLSGNVLQDVDFEEEKAARLLFAADGRVLAIIGLESHRLIEIPSGDEIARIPAEGYALRAQFLAEARYLAMESCEQVGTCGEKHVFRLIDASNGEPLLAVNLAGGEEVILGEAGRYILIKSGTLVRVIELPNGDAVGEHSAEEDDPFRTALISELDRRLVLVTKAGTVRVVDVASGEEVSRVVYDCESDGSPARYKSEGLGLVTCTEDRMLTLEPTGVTLHALNGSVLGFSTDARLAAIEDPDSHGVVHVIETATGRELVSVSNTDLHALRKNMAFSQHGQYLALPRGPWGHAYLVDLSGAHRLSWLDISDTRPHPLTSDGKVIAYPDADRFVRLLNLETGEEMALLEHEERARPALFGHGDNTLLTEVGDGLRLFDVASGETLAALESEGPAYARVASPDRRFVVTQVGDAAALRELASLRELNRFEYPSGVGFLFKSDAQRQSENHVSGGSARTVPCSQKDGEALDSNVNNLDSDPIFRLVANVNDLDFSPDSRLLAAVWPLDRTTRILDTATGRVRLCIETDPKPLLAEFSPDGKTLALAVFDNSIRLIDIATGNERLRLNHEWSPTEVNTGQPRFSPDGRLLAVIDESEFSFHVALFDTNGGSKIPDTETVSDVQLDSWQLDPLRHFAVDFAADGQLFAVGARGTDPARLFDRTGNEIAQVPLGDGPKGVAFSPDGRYLAAFNRSGRVALLDSDARYEPAFVQHADALTDISFSPDSRYLASASEDGTVRVMDTASMDEVARFELGSPVESAGFTPNGKWLVTRSDGKTRFLWADPDWPFEQLCARLGRNLSHEEWQILFGAQEDWRPTCPEWRN